jgi:hypothetical protein
MSSVTSVAASLARRFPRFRFVPLASFAEMALGGRPEAAAPVITFTKDYADAQQNLNLVLQMRRGR